MSYILEALRKADAERERGAVPDLKAQPLPIGPGGDEAAPTPALPWGYAGIGLVLALLAGGAWWWLRGDDVPAVAVAPPAAASAALAPPAAAAVAGPASTPAPAAAATVTAATAAPPAPPPAAARAANPPARPKPPANAQPKAVAKAPPAPALATAPPVPERLQPLAELAGDLRQQVPPMAIGGSVYSPQARARMVVINGQVFQEGSQLAPELKLEQIRPKSAVFSIRGQRFEVPL